MFLDLFVGNTDRSHTTNVMFRHGRTKFVKARVGVARELSTAGSSWADWDRDGDPDLVVQQHYPEATVAYENVRNRYRPVRLRGITGKTWLAATWGDFNGDGWPDVAMVGNDNAAIFRNRRGRFDRLEETSSPFNIVPPSVLAVPHERTEPAKTFANAQGGGRLNATTGRVDWSVVAYRGFEPFEIYQVAAATALQPT